MTVLSPATVYDLARGAGLNPSQAVIATAIAAAESGLRTDAIGDEGIQTDRWGPSVGLWQIRSLKADLGTGRARDASKLGDPAFNARAMVEISGGGANWRPWSVYTSGRYRNFLGREKETTTLDGGRAGGYVSDPKTDNLNGYEQLADAAGDALGGWAGDALGVGMKLLLTVGALGLLVVGMSKAVTR